MPEESDSFKKHYDNLRAIADKMKSQQEPDIDELVPMVDSALASYKFCKDRLEKVKKTLDEKFEGAVGETAG